MECASTAILFAILGDAVCNRGKLFVHDVLVDFGATAIASVAVHKEKGLDF
jgi:hypothetical protein